MLAKMDVIMTRFVIRPNGTLKANLERCECELGELLLQTTLWTKTEGQRTVWSPEDRMAQVKLLFLASLKNEYSSNPNFVRVLGDLPLRVSRFDELWTIEEIEDEEVLEDVEKEIQPSVLEHLEETGRPAVDAWISDLRAKTSAIARGSEPRPASAVVGVKG
jgi:hypothetical protein